MKCAVVRGGHKLPNLKILKKQFFVVTDFYGPEVTVWSTTHLVGWRRGQPGACPRTRHQACCLVDVAPLQSGLKTWVLTEPWRCLPPQLHTEHRRARRADRHISWKMITSTIPSPPGNLRAPPHATARWLRGQRLIFMWPVLGSR